MEGTVLCAANHAPLTPISFLERTTLVYPDRPAIIAAGHAAPHLAADPGPLPPPRRRARGARRRAP